MSTKVSSVLFLCTGNSARSVMAEAILNKAGAGRFSAFSAGSHPAGQVNPLTISLLDAKGYDTGFARSKSWNEFAGPTATPVDFVFTVCDAAAGETCPIWPGHPMSAHWGIPDPAAATGTIDEQRTAFANAYDRLARRIAAFLALPVATLDPETLKTELNAIGRMKD